MGLKNHKLCLEIKTALIQNKKMEIMIDAKFLQYFAYYYIDSSIIFIKLLIQ